MNTTKDHTAKPPRVASCVCDHKAQDAYHGKGNRVHNPCKSNESGKTGYRCTVCGREHAH
jgi:hypothetical protein